MALYRSAALLYLSSIFTSLWQALDFFTFNIITELSFFLDPSNDDDHLRRGRRKDQARTGPRDAQQGQPRVLAQPELVTAGRPFLGKR